MPDAVHEDAGGQRVLRIDEGVGELKSGEGFALGGGVAPAQDLEKSGGRRFAKIFRIAAHENLHGLSAALDAGHDGAGGGRIFRERVQLRLQVGELFFLGFVQQSRAVILGDETGGLGVFPEHGEEPVLFRSEGRGFL